MWRVAVAGLPEFLAYCRKYPGRSIFELACQGCELIIGIAKLYCNSLGTGKPDMPRKLAEYLDISGICTVGCDQINVAKMLHTLLYHRKLIFDDDLTPQFEQQIENKFPSFALHIVKLCDKWEPDDPEPPSLINQIHSRIKLTPNAWGVDEITQIAQNAIGVKVCDGDLIDETSEEYQQIVSELQTLYSNQNSNNILRFAKAKIHNELSV